MAPRDRKDLGLMLRDILESSNVYFQAPPNTGMKYPCILYSYSSGDTQFADDNPYIFMKRYTITVIDTNPDSDIPDKVIKLPRCRSDRNYTSDNLHHWVFNLYF